MGISINSYGRKCSILCCIILHCNFQEGISNIKLGLAVLLLLNSTSSRCHIRTAETFDDSTEVVYGRDTATVMRGADKWFMEDENQSHMRLDIWIVRKKRDREKESFSFIQCLLLAVLLSWRQDASCWWPSTFCACSLVSVRAAYTHVIIQKAWHVQLQQSCDMTSWTQEMAFTSTGNAPMTANRQKSLLLCAD